MASYNIDYQIRRYNGSDWDNLFPYTKAANVSYGNNSNVGAALGTLDSNLSSHTGNTNNPHSVTKAQVGLGNVENKSPAQLKTAFTGSVSDQSDGFPIGSDVYDAINTAISAVYKPKGSSSTVPTLSSVEEGWVYDISAAFTTTADFVEGAGKTYPAGTNIVCIMVSDTKKWDVLTGVVDLSGYVPTSRKVNNKALSSDISIGADDIDVGGYDISVKTFLVNLNTNKQDKVTAERGLSFGTGTGDTNKLGHSNSITELTTTSLKKIKYDAYGHITGSANVIQDDIDPYISASQYVVKITAGSNPPANPKTGDIWLYGTDEH